MSAQSPSHNDNSSQQPEDVPPELNTDINDEHNRPEEEEEEKDREEYNNGQNEERERSQSPTHQPGESLPSHEDSQATNEQNSDSQKSTDYKDRKPGYSTYARRPYDNRSRGGHNSYPRTDVRDARPYRGGYQGSHYTRDDFQRRGPPVISDHRNFDSRRGDYSNPNYAGPGGRGGYKRNYEAFPPNDPAPKRIRRSPDNYRGGYEPRGRGFSRPYGRGGSPPPGPPPNRNYEGGYHGSAYQPPAPRGYGDIPRRSFDDQGGYERPSYGRGGPPIYDNIRGGGFQRGGRGSFNRYEDRGRPMSNEQDRPPFEYNNRGGGSYNSSRGNGEERYPPRDAPLVIDRRATSDRYPFNPRGGRNTSFEDRTQQRNGSYYDQQSGSTASTGYSEQQQPTYRDNQQYSRGYSNNSNTSGGYGDYSSEQPTSSTTSTSSSSYSSYNNTNNNYSDSKQSSSEPVTQLPPNWQEYSTKDGKKYYYNSINKTTQWELPTEK